MGLNKLKSGKYQVDIYLHSGGGRMRLSAYTDKRASLKLFENIKQLDACIAAGERPDRELQLWLETLNQEVLEKLSSYNLLSQLTVEKSKPTLKHIEDFLEYQDQQSVKGVVTEKQNRMLKSYLLRLAKECKLKFNSDITSRVIDSWVTGKYRANELSAKSCNHYLQAMKQFCRWLIDNNRIYDNPVAMLKPIKLNSGNTAQRRALTEEEITGLLQAAMHNPSKHNGLNGQERALVYQLALYTGLRLNEIRTLARSDFDFEHHTVTVRDINSKNSNTDVLPLKEVLGRQLEDYFCSNPALPKARAFKKMGERGYRMIQKDLANANIDYITEEGKADFHALRHTFCSTLARKGVLPQVAQRLMRHSDINLTMKNYTHILIMDKREAISALPEIDLMPQEELKEVVNGGSHTGFSQVDMKVNTKENIKSKATRRTENETERGTKGRTKKSLNENANKQLMSNHTQHHNDGENKHSEELDHDSNNDQVGNNIDELIIGDSNIAQESNSQPQNHSKQPLRNNNIQNSELYDDQIVTNCADMIHMRMDSLGHDLVNKTNSHKTQAIDSQGLKDKNTAKSSVLDSANNHGFNDTNGGGGGNRTRVLQYYPKELLRV